MKKAVLTLGLLVVLAVPATAQPTTISSPDGQRTLTVYDSGLVVYQSANGVLRMQVKSNGIEIGNFSFSGSNIRRTGRVVDVRFDVRYGTDSVADEVTIDDLAA